LAAAALITVAAGGEFWVRHPGFAGIAAHAPSYGSSGETALVGTPSLQDVVLEAKDSGIQMRDGEAVVSELRSNSRGDVVYSVNAQGGVGASYVDNKTGMVTVNSISYGQ
jgi:hypothetical protein